MCRRVCIVLFVFGLLLTAYFGWAHHRASGSVIANDAAWPRPHPWPDAWLMDLHDWLDTRYPAAPGSIKMHGELFRLRAIVLGALVLSISLMLAAGIPLVWHRVRHRPGYCRKCQYDLRGSSGQPTCPECGADVEQRRH